MSRTLNGKAAVTALPFLLTPWASGKWNFNVLNHLLTCDSHHIFTKVWHHSSFSVSLKNCLMQRCNLYWTHCFTWAASLSLSTTAPTACFKYPQLQVALHVGVNNFKSLYIITDLFLEDIIFLFVLTWGTFIYCHFKPGHSVLCSVWIVAQNSGTFWINLEFLLSMFSSFLVNLHLLE